MLTPKIEADIAHNKIPTVKYDQIYKIGSFDFLEEYRIKTAEHSLSIKLHNGQTSVKLFRNEDLQCLNPKYKYIHIAAVQVAIIPNHRIGLDKPIFIALKDGRFNEAKDAILSVISTNVSWGPIYFENYPDLSSEIDKAIKDSLGSV